MAPAAPAKDPKSGANACQLEISQPLVRLKVALTALPLNDPVTTATCGPPYCSVHMRLGAGTGKNIFSPCCSTAASAAAGSGNVLPAAGVDPSAIRRNWRAAAPGASVNSMVRSISLLALGAAEVASGAAGAVLGVCCAHAVVDTTTVSTSAAAKTRKNLPMATTSQCSCNGTPPPPPRSLTNGGARRDKVWKACQDCG